LKQYPRYDEIPFDSSRKMMTTIHQKDKKFFTFTKGAPEILLKHCNYILINGKKEKLTAQYRKKILQHNQSFAQEALRVLAFAYQEFKNTKNIQEDDLIFIGLQAMIDPPRQEAKEAILTCKKA